MRFDQCTETCTTDCGHCKGRPVAALREDNERLSRRLAGRFEETEKLRAKIEHLEQDVAFWREQRDLAANVAAGIADLDEQAPALRQMLRTEKQRREAEEARSLAAEAEVASLRQQLGEARDAAKSAIDEALALAEAQLRVIDQRDAAEADRDRLAGEVKALIAAYRAGTPAEAPAPPQMCYAEVTLPNGVLVGAERPCVLGATDHLTGLHRGPDGMLWRLTHDGRLEVYQDSGLNAVVPHGVWTTITRGAPAEAPDGERT